MPRIRIKNVSKAYGTVQALNNFNLTIEDGEYFCLLGPTGAGKTSLLYILAGIRRPDNGDILFDDQVVTDLLPEHRRIGFVWESHNLFPHMTVLENVLYGRRVKGYDLNEARNVAKGILDMVLLKGRDSAKPSELSGGMRQRLGVARALAAAETQMLLMDEPYGALDAKIRTELRMEIRDLTKELGLTCIHATHDTEEALMVADRVAVMNLGRCIQVDSPESIYRAPKNRFIAQFVSESNDLNVKIKSVDHRFVECILADTQVKALGCGVIEGEKGVLVIKSENLHLKKVGKDPKGTLIGTIERIKFVGEFYRFIVRLVDGQKMICRALPGKTAKFAAKESVAIDFNANNGFVFPIEDHESNA